MATLTLDIDGLERTAVFGRALAGLVRVGDVVLLDGELGSGKTTLVRSVCLALGVDESAVSSPTYVVAQSYEGRVRVAHLDAYRLDGAGAGELEELGWEAFAPGAVVLIEWGSRVAGAVDEIGVDAVARLAIEPTGAESRRVTLDVPEAWTEREGWSVVERMSTGENGEPRGERYDTVCRVTGRAVLASNPSWPFADERARLADLYKWMAEDYTVSRPVEMNDLEETE